MEKNYDFCGWATRNGLKCSDGRVIMQDAFKENDGKKVPLVWNHQHNEPMNVLGHAVLENRADGVYTYGKFNESESGKAAKLLVENGDVNALSIFANQLRQNGANVIHGNIREVSLVLAGANPGAFIESVIKHDDSSDEEAVIYTGENLELSHSEEDESASDEEESITHADEEEKKEETWEETDNSDSDDETVADVFNTLTDKQKEVVYAMIGQALEHSDEDKSDENNIDETEGGNETMKHNVFDTDKDTQKENVLSHDAMNAIIGDAKRYGSMKESFLQHAEEYGIDNLEYLFPDDKNALGNTPIFIQRDTSWVRDFMGSVHHTPFSRIKSIFADITEDEARAKGYIKGKLKKEEVFSLLKRTTSPTTIYKKQKMDRDDVIDITDFDVITWLKSEMRLMLDEEIARAGLVGDGRLASSDDKISEQNIRPIWTDSDLFTIKAAFSVSAGATDDDKAKAFIRACIKARKDYKGSGNPILFTTEDIVTNCLLLTDANGRDLYDSIEKLATKLRVRKIVTVPVMEGLTRNGTGDDSSSKYELFGIIVNPADYNMGADKGGAINMFDDFDIDYNQQKYLIETRCSGALIRPYSAIAVELKTGAGA